MPISPRETSKCNYHYDALDRLAHRTPHSESDTRRFYCNDRLVTEIQGAKRTHIFQHEDQLLAQQQSQSGKCDTTLLATDQQRSVLHTLTTTSLRAFAYTPYGHNPKNGLPGLPGYTGEQPDPVTGHIHLGNGFRQFNPVLMRFNRPESTRYSPFREGGLNAYAYCAGDPVNNRDPNGHAFFGVLLTVLGVGAIAGGSVLIKKNESSAPLFFVGLALTALGVGMTLGGLAFASVPGRRPGLHPVARISQSRYANRASISSGSTYSARSSISSGSTYSARSSISSELSSLGRSQPTSRQAANALNPANNRIDLPPPYPFNQLPSARPVSPPPPYESLEMTNIRQR
ncbi:RHS repeat-associated core domain-containing protein [Pseudomonas sp. G(2018)]|uniref:RHS repeat-associated core domain-containing protein n=1 Tax=Pseudomonas sp. G(2018) TaxID=2502242 RepID=UPI0010F69A1C|nr:RHS repeat-associated core domain-containing protein [Pseudomonas sp. G(2018)]